MNLIRARLTGHHKVYAVVYTRRMVTKFRIKWIQVMWFATTMNVHTAL